MRKNLELNARKFFLGFDHIFLSLRSSSAFIWGIFDATQTFPHQTSNLSRFSPYSGAHLPFEDPHVKSGPFCASTLNGNVIMVRSRNRIMIRWFCNISIVKHNNSIVNTEYDRKGTWTLKTWNRFCHKWEDCKDAEHWTHIILHRTRTSKYYQQI